MALREREIQHILRRAGFGTTQRELETYAELGTAATIERLVNYEQVPDEALFYLTNGPGYARVSDLFSPNTNIGHARQRWLFRMLYSTRPLQDKMTIFLHDLFSTSYVKISDLYGGEVATRMMSARPTEDLGGMRGQIEMLRDNALGSYRDLLLRIAQDPAMLVWLDGETNKRGKPQENFAREVMELFTISRLNHTENDVYEGARVFTGWNLRRIGASSDPSRRYEFFYDATQHDTGAKTFSFPIYTNGGTTIPARAADQGIQDGIDLIDALARHPATGSRLAKRMWYFFVSELTGPPPEWETRVAAAYYSSGYSLRVMMLKVLTSAEFLDPTNHFSRYSWPVEFVVRALKEVGADQFPLSTAVNAMNNMDQALYAPPSVGGWLSGPGWFSTGAFIARKNFAASVLSNQKTNFRNAVRPFAQTPQKLLSHCLDRLAPMPYDAQPETELLQYLGRGVNWSGSDTELGNKAAGLAHLILASSEYQLV